MKMDRRNFLLSGPALASALVARAQTESSKLEVQVTYGGSGTVDEMHKIYVVLWDKPDFVSGNTSTEPIGVKPIVSKSATAQFDDIKKSPVYISMVFDPTGKWDATAPPGPGSSLGLYATEPGTPAPVQLQPGKSTRIAATFDDSFKMQ
jgi:hypothetical protein